VRKQVVEIREAQPKYVLILAGDHLYRMDYGHFVQRHIETGAEVTIAVQPVVREEVSGLGILKLDEHNQIARFVEKPKSEAELEGLESRTDSDKPYMASMGIYVFATDLLFELLEAEGDDFGSEIIPAAIQDRRVMGYVFDGYWEDIGTIQRFFEVNLAIASPETEFDFYSPERPIYTRARFLPTSEIVDSTLDEVLLTDGCRIHGARVESAVVGLRSIISPEVSIKSTILMGADFYEMDEAKAENKQLGRPEVGVGPGSIIERAIIDKNARIGRNVKIRSLPNRLDTDGENWVSREGIVIVPKNAIIPDGAVI
jgi:glucose-1-phosphate adenylyltransferase